MNTFTIENHGDTQYRLQHADAGKEDKIMKLEIPSIQLSRAEILIILDACMKDQRTLSGIPCNLQVGINETFGLLGNTPIEEIILPKILAAHSVTFYEPYEAAGQFLDIINMDEDISVIGALKKMIADSTGTNGE